MLPQLPIPSEEWLVAFNAECRTLEIAAGERPFRALARWAEEHGQKADQVQLLMSHLATPAFNAIYRFFQANTSLGREHAAPYRQTCFLYDTAFWPVIVPVVYGRGTFDPIRFIVGMPGMLFRDLGFDVAARDELDAHWFDCLHHLNNRILINQPGLPEFARSFLAGGDKALLAAADTLLAVPPNQKAVEGARDAFESTLKGFAVIKTNLTEQEARNISHKLIGLVARCAPHLPNAECVRLKHVCSLYPKVGVRYQKGELSSKQLWECYREAQHTMAVVLRVISGETI